MIVLGIETSCDETAVGIVEDGKKLLANEVFSSMDLHTLYGGVVPEIAARSHIESMTPVLQQALQTAFPSLSEDEAWDKIDAIAVTHGAGLGGSLLVGVMTARTLAIAKNKPLYAINHVEAHVYANFLTSTGSALPASESSSADRKASLDDTALSVPPLSRSSSSTTSSGAHSCLVSSQSPAPVTAKEWEVGENSKPEARNTKQISNYQTQSSKTHFRISDFGSSTFEWQLGNLTYTLPSEQPQFPLLALIVSGGHTQLALFRDHFDYTLLGQTRDDAIGEAFDKVAKITGLPYPGGPNIAKAAEHGDSFKFSFPKSKLDEKYEFSFSGVKTAVLRTAQDIIGEDFTFPSHKVPERLSEAQRNDIAASFQRIAMETVVDKTVLAFEEFEPKSVVIAGGVAASKELRRQLTERIPIDIAYTDIKLCTDNGAMIATLGCYKAMLNQETADPYSLEIDPNLSM